MVRRSKSGCFRILGCAGGGDVDDEEGKATSNKESCSCWKRSTKSQVLSNSAIADVRPNKDISDVTGCNACSPKSSSLGKLLEQEKPTGTIILSAADVDLAETHNLVDYDSSIPVDQNHPNKDLSTVTTENVCSPKCSSSPEKHLDKDKPNETMLLSPAKVDSEDTYTPANEGNSTKIDVNHHEAATIVIQSYVRRYLTRRERQKFRSAVKMQAVARGYLVRRQAIGTLRCALAIIKIQALVRARQSRQSVENLAAQEDKVEDSYSEPHKTYSSMEKLLLNGFARQIMETMRSKKSIRVKCDPSKSDSAWRWLERWMAITSSDMGQHNNDYCQEQDESNKLPDNHEVDDVPDVSSPSISILTHGGLVVPTVNEGTFANRSSTLEFQALVSATDSFSSSSVDTGREINLPENEPTSFMQDDPSKTEGITEITSAQKDLQTDTTTELILDSVNKSEPDSQNLMHTSDFASCGQLETEGENIYSGKSCGVVTSTLNEGAFTAKNFTSESQALTYATNNFSSPSVETRQELNLPENEAASLLQEDPSKTGLDKSSLVSFTDQNDLQSDTTKEPILNSINNSEPDGHDLMHASELASCEELKTEESIRSGKSCEIIMPTITEGVFMTESSRLGFQASVVVTDNLSSSSLETRQEIYLPENEAASLMQDDPSKTEGITQNTSASTTAQNDLQADAATEYILDPVNKSESRSSNLMHASDFASYEQLESEEDKTVSGKSCYQDDMSPSLFEELNTNSIISGPSNSDCQGDNDQATILANLQSEEDASKKNDINLSEISLSDDLPVHNVASKCGTGIAVSSTLDPPSRRETEDEAIIFQIEASEKASHEVDSDGDIDVDILNMHVGAKNSFLNSEVKQLQRLEEGEEDIPDSVTVVDSVHVDKQQDETTMLSMSTQMASLTGPQIILSPEGTPKGHVTFTQSHILSPEGTPKGHATVTESHTTSTQIFSEDAKGSKTNNSVPGKRQRSRRLRKKQQSGPSDDSGGNSTENIPKDPKNIKRRNSFGMAKPDHVDNEYKTSDSNSLPSYMQATQSARAKAHASNPLILSPDVCDNREKRRHSLPSGNGKPGSSPQMLRSKSQAQQSPKERRWQI